MSPLLPIAFLLALYPMMPSLELDAPPVEAAEEKVCACPTSGNTYTVTTLADSGDGSLREAITCCNADPDLDIIIFNISGSGPHVISLLDELPRITDDNVSIDGGPNFDIEINGSLLSGALNGLIVDGASDVGISGLIISSFPDDGISIDGAESTRIIGNVIVNNGTDGPNGEGIYVFNSSVDPFISGNYIGVLSDGNTPFGNSGDGIDVVDTDMGFILANVIGANGSGGILLTSCTEFDVADNLIGVNESATSTIGNGGPGIQIDDCDGVQLSFFSTPGNNVIGGNAFDGIIFNNSSNTEILGNYIGTNSTGTEDLGNNGYGIVFANSSNTIFTGFTTGSPSFNLIAFNDTGIAAVASSCQGILLPENITFCNSNGIVISNGANNGITAPVITSTSDTEITGTASSGSGTEIEVFKSDNSSCFGNNACQGAIYLGSTTVDFTNNWSLTSLQASISDGDQVTAIAHAPDGSSAYADCVTVGPNCPMGSAGLSASTTQSCVGEDYTLTITIIDGTPPYDVTIFENGTPITYNNITSPHVVTFNQSVADLYGYNITAVVDDNGCTDFTTPLVITDVEVEEISANAAGPLEDCPVFDMEGIFNLTSLDFSIGGGQSVSWYTDASATQSISNPSSYQTGSTTVYAVVTNGNCFSSPEPISIVVYDPPLHVPVTVPTEACVGETYTVTVDIVASGTPPYELTVFENGISVYSQSGLSAGSYSFDRTQTTAGIYTYETDILDANFCEPTSIPAVVYSIDILDAPTANAAGPLQSCDSDGDGQETFDLNALDNTINGGTGNTVNWYEDAGGFVSIGNPSFYFSSSTTVYAEVDNGTCQSSLEPVTLTVLVSPIITAPADQLVCDAYVLPAITGSNLSGNEAYYTGDNGTGTQFFPGQSITFSTWLYVYDINNGCEAQAGFQIDIINSPSIFSAGPLEACDDGSGQATFNLTALDNTINGGTGNTVNWYEDFGTTQAINFPSIYTTTSTIVYATVFDGICESSPEPITLNVSPPPSPVIIGDTELCFGEAGILSLTQAYSSYSWSTGSPNPSIAISSGGTYSVTVTDGNGCTGNATVFVTEFAPPQPVISGPDGLCSGAADFLDGGSGYVTYAWNTGGNAQLLAIDQAGLYELTVIDGNGCTGSAFFFVDGSAVDLTCSEASSASAPGVADGSASITINGGTGAYTLDWSGPTPGNLVVPDDGTYTLPALESGAYSLSLTDTYSCEYTCTFTITDPGCQIALSCFELNPASNPDTNDGAASINVQGGTAPYTLSWSGASSGTQNLPTEGFTPINNLLGGSYSLTVTDDNSCEQTCDFVINVSCNLTLSAVVTDLSCFQSGDGSIDLSVSNGTLPFTFDWSNNADTEDINNLSAGTYSVNVTDGGGCTASLTEMVGEPDELLVNATIIDTDCEGEPSGGIDLQISGGTPPYMVNWSNGAGTLGISDLAAGSYMVTVTDENDCESINTYTVECLTISCDRVQDSLALVDFYNATDGPNWTNNWDLNSPIDTWYGVFLNGEGCVEVLDLDGDPDGLSISNTGNNLNGPLIDVNLTQMRLFFVAGNNLFDSIPNFSYLISLEQFECGSNNLNGNIPDFTNTPNLEVFHCGENDLEGSIPDFSNLALLRNFFCYRNNLSGSIPDFTNLPLLESIYCYDNNLEDSIPDFSNMPNFNTFYCYNNNLSGVIPAFANVDLRVFGCDNNNISGTIPDFPNAPNLSYFDCANNDLEGLIPDFSDNCPNLRLFHHERNQFTFEDILPNLDNNQALTLSNAIANADSVRYNPQDSIYTDTLITGTLGNPLTIDLGIDENEAESIYQWYKDGVAYTTITGNNNLTFANLQASDAGNYWVHITNPGAPDLTLLSRNIVIQINIAPNLEASCLNDTTYSTGPFDCFAAFDAALPIVTTDCPSYEVLTEVLSINGSDTTILATIQWEDVDRSVSGVSQGIYMYRFTVTTDCDDNLIIYCPFRVEDLQEPVAVCDDEIVVQIGTEGMTSIFATDINEGSFDNCLIDAYEIRRSDFDSLSNTCGNDFSPWSDFVTFYCCDVGIERTIEMRVTDSTGNSNICWLSVTPTYDGPPLCIPPPDVNIACLDLPIGFDGQDTTQLQQLFGNASASDQCTNTVEEQQPLTALSSCGVGSITRTFTASNQGGEQNTCQQTITITASHDFAVQFPADTEVSCGESISNTIFYEESACDLIAIALSEDAVSDPGPAALLVTRSWRVINWCQYDGISAPYIIDRDEDCDGSPGDEDLWLLFNNGQTYFDRDNDNSLGNNIPSAAENLCNGIADYWRADTYNGGFYEYDQLLNVYAIEVGLDSTYCADSTACSIDLSIPFTFNSCFGLDMATNVMVDLDEDNDGAIETTLAPTGSYPNFTVDFTEIPIGSHRLSISFVDGDGNNLEQEAFFEVQDCHISNLSCSDPLLVVLGPLDTNNDGTNDGGYAEVSAAAFTNDNLVDCSNPIQYTANLLGEQPDSTAFNIAFSCADTGFIDLEIWAWDAAGNSTSCQTMAIVVDNDGNCIESSPQPTFFITPATSNITVGSTISLDIRVSNFNDILGTQYFVRWDSTILQFNNISSVNDSDFEGLSIINFGYPGLGAAPGGQVALSWFEPDLNPGSVPDSTIMYTIELSAIACGSTDMFFGDSVLAEGEDTIQVINSSFLEIGHNAQNALITVAGAGCNTPPTFAISPDNATIEVGDTFTFEVTVADFLDVVSTEYSINWDSTLFEFVDVININDTDFTGLDMSDFAMPGGSITAEQLGIVWFDPSFNGISLLDDTRMFSFRLRAIDCEASDVIFADAPVIQRVLDSNFDDIGLIAMNSSVTTVCTVELAIGSADIEMGTSFCIPVTVGGFTDVLSWQFSINYDPDQLQFDNISNINSAIPGYSVNNFGVPPVLPEGQITTVYSDPDVFGITLNSGDTLFELCFTAISDMEGTCSDIIFSPNPTSIEFTDSNENPMGSLLQFGTICQQAASAPVSLTIADETVAPGTSFCLPISMQDFMGVAGMQFTINYDTNNLTLDQISNLNTSLVGFTVQDNINASTPGLIALSYAEPNNTELDFPDGAILMELCFTSNLNTGNCTDVFFSGDFLTPEFSDGNASDIPFALNDGQVCAPAQTLPLEVVIGSVNVDPGESFCVPISVNNFDDVLGMQFSLNYDPTLFEYNGLNNINATLEGFSDGQIGTPDEGLEDGNITVNYFAGSLNPQSLNDGSILFEVCFTAANCGNACADFVFSGNPTSVEFVDGDQNIIDFTSQSGTFCINDNGTNCNPVPPQEVTFAIGDTLVEQNEQFCVPITNVNTFEGMLAIASTIRYDENILDFEEVRNLSPLLPGFDLATHIGTPDGGLSPGNITFSYFDFDFPAVSVPAGTTIFEICFTATGTCGTCSPLEFTSDVTAIEFADLNETPVTFNSQSGTACIAPAATGNYEDLLCPDESYTPFPGGPTFDFDNPSGTAFVNCDTAVQVDLSFYPLNTVPVPVLLCPGETTNIGGVVYGADNPQGISVIPNGDVITGCDLQLEVMVTFYEEVVTEIDDTLCPGDTLFVNGIAYHEGNPSGTQTFDEVTENGCDSLLEINLNFFPEAINMIETVLCPGDTLMVNGIAYYEGNATGEQLLAGQSANGCDSTIMVAVSFYQEAVGVLATTICPGDTLIVNGEPFYEGNTSGTQLLENASSNGCDSILQISVGFFDEAIGNLNLTICEGDTIFVNGTAYHGNNTAGSEILDNQSVNGCDSTLMVNVSFFEEAVGSLSAEICFGDTLIVNGTPYYEDNPNGTEILENASSNGCDSLLMVSISFIEVLQGFTEVVICEGESYTFGGNVLTEAGVYQDTVMSLSSGCDSIIELTLLVFEHTFGGELVNICEGESYNWNGWILDETGTYEDQFINANGCDSTATLTLVINEVVATNFSDSFCSGETYEWGGQTYNTAGTYMQTFQQQNNGCDSIVTLFLSENITIMPGAEETLINYCENESPPVISVTVPAGVTVDWYDAAIGGTLLASNSLTYNTPGPGIYYAEARDIDLSCVSGDRLAIEVVEQETYSQSTIATTCDPMEAGFDTTTYTSQFGCDSLVITQMIVLPIVDPTYINTTTCDSLALGQDTTVYQSQFGCDSLVIANVTYAPLDTTFLSGPTCDLESVGEFSFNFISTQGCDSIVVLSLDFDTSLIAITEILVCDSLAIGMDTALLETPLGCDSLAISNYVLAPAITTEIDSSLCEGDSILIAGVYITSEGEYLEELITAEGCDSIVQLSISILEASTTFLEDMICPGVPYSFGDSLLTEAGMYEQVFINSAGCDSTVSLILEESMPVILGATADEFIYPAFENSMTYDIIQNDTTGNEEEWILQIGESPLQGNLTITADNMIIYSLTNDDFLGVDSFSYKLCPVLCPSSCSEAIVRVAVQEDCLTEIEANLPTGFTPDGDGFNDIFDPIGEVDVNCLQSPENGKITIISSWGEIIYEAEPYQAWDGRVNGKIAPQGTYYYILRFEVDEEIVLRKPLYLLK